MSAAPASRETGCAREAHAAVVGLADDAYRGMSWCEESVRSCLASIDSALRERSVRSIRRWVDYQLDGERAEFVLACLETSLSHVAETAPDTSAADRSFLRELRAAAGAQLTARAQETEMHDAMSPEARGQADACMRMVASWDATTAEHMEACGALCERLARHLKLDEAAVSRAALLGRLHDIGLVAVSRGVLQKPLALSREERADLEMHPLHGASILAGIAGLAPLAPLVRAHHERVDGKGYPDGLRGEEIPLEARILAVVDAWLSITTARPGMLARSPQEAFRELYAGAGTQFDAPLVAAFAAMFGYSAAADPVIDITGFRAG